MTRSDLMILTAQAWPTSVLYDAWALLGEEHIRKLVAVAAKAERNACAELCERTGAHYDDFGDPQAAAGADDCAIAIRARNKT